jgi:hypothetical protein
LATQDHVSLTASFVRPAPDQPRAMSLILLPILAQAISLTMGASGEARVRTVGTTPYEDVATTGQVALNVDLRRTSWTLSYSPTVTQLAIGTPGAYLNVVHSFGLVSRLQLSERTTMNFTENATYGQRNFRQMAVSAPLPTVGDTGTSGTGATGSPPDTSTPGNSSDPQGGSAVLTAPGDRTIRFGSLTSGVGLQHVLARNWSTGASASYAIMGELDTYEPPVFPKRRTYQVDVQLSHLLSRSDSVTLSSSASYVLMEPNAESKLVSATSNWRHTLTRNASMSLFGAAYFVDAVDRLGNHRIVVLPGAGGTLSANIPVQPRPSSLTVFLSGDLAPRVDYQYGGISNGMSTNAGVTWTRNRLMLQVAGYVWHSLGHYGATSVRTIYGMTESITYRLDRPGHWSVTVGGRQAMQDFSSGQQMPFTWVWFVGLSYTTGAMYL